MKYQWLAKESGCPALSLSATWDANGLDPATTALQARPQVDGRYELASLRLEADGKTYAIAAVTSPEEIALVRGEDRARGAPDTQAPAREPDHPSQPASDTTERRPPPVPDTFAPALSQGRDLRDSAHPGHDAFREMCHRARGFENLHNIPHGPHTDRIGAAMLAWAVENKVDYQSVHLGRDPATGALQMSGQIFTGDAKGETVAAPFDPKRLSAQAIETSSQGVNAALSPHYAAPEHTRITERTREHAQVLGALNESDQILFSRIRRDIPGHVTDDHVLRAMTQAKEAGTRDARDVGTVMMLGQQIAVTGPAAQTVTVDTNQPAPSLQQSLDKNQTLSQQLAMQQNNPTQDAATPDGPGSRGPRV